MDLNNAYEYESERRNDERRAAAESQWVRELGRKRVTRMPSALVFGVLLALLFVVLRVL